MLNPPSTRVQVKHVYCTESAPHIIESWTPVWEPVKPRPFPLIPVRTLSQFPSRSLKDSPHFEMLKNLKAVENEIWVQGRRAEAECEIMQLTVGSVTEMGL